MMMNSNFQKRELFRIAAASAVAAAGSVWVPRSAWSQPSFRENPFTLGVASGSPSSDSVVIWTRLALDGLFGSSIGKDPITVQWEVADDERFSRNLLKGQTQAVVSLAHSVHVEVLNLAPDRWYFYRFTAGNAVSPVGRTRTLPAPNALVSRLRLAYASCQRWEHGYFSAYEHMLKEELDLVLFLGDYIYEYPAAQEAVRNPTGGWVTDLEGYRKRYALHRSEASLRAMHAACPWLITWDDHEVQNDYAGTTVGENGPAVADFLVRRAQAYQAFYEHMPLRASALTRSIAGLVSGAEMRIYGNLQFGRLASVSLLDNRQYKSPIVCTRNGQPGSSNVDPAQCPPWSDATRSMLGIEQEEWLAKTSAKVQGPWHVIGQSSAFGTRDFKAGQGQSFWNDGWDGYASSRDRVRDMLRAGSGLSKSMPVMLGGDVHANWVGHIKADYAKATSENIGVEFCGTSITARGGTNVRTAEWLNKNPHYVYINQEVRGYGVADFTPTRLTTTLRGLDDVRQKETKVSTLATYVVEAGKPVLS